MNALNDTPIISVIMANYNGESYLAAALESVLGQSVREIEVIVSDDASSDGSVAIAEAVAATDPRVHVLSTTINGGPGASRNRALDAARGDWVAIIDSDDLILPDRFAEMLAAAEHHSADAVADDLTYFGDVDARRQGRFLPDGFAVQPMRITPEVFLRSDLPGPQHAPLGYLKPMIRRRRIGGLRYHEGLRIGEDHDFFLRLLLSGLDAILLPQSYYLYRRRSSSISHRMGAGEIGAMIEAQDRLVVSEPGISAPLRVLFDRRRRHLGRELRFAELVARIKGRDARGTLAILLRDPPILRKLAKAAREHFARRTRRLAE
ncbi:MAG: glycosyltransferase family 2 protein [Paracoccaceae bacterium]